MKTGHHSKHKSPRTHRLEEKKRAKKARKEERRKEKRKDVSEVLGSLWGRGNQG